MHFIIHPVWFYFMHVVDAIGCIGLFITIIGGGCSFIIGFHYLMEGNISSKAYKTMRISFIVCVVGLFLLTFVPDEDTMKEMMVAKMLTNVDYGKAQLKETVNYIFEKIDDMSDEKEDKSNE